MLARTTEVMRVRAEPATKGTSSVIATTCIVGKPSISTVYEGQARECTKQDGHGQDAHAKIGKPERCTPDVVGVQGEGKAKTGEWADRGGLGI